MHSKWVGLPLPVEWFLLQCHNPLVSIGHAGLHHWPQSGMTRTVHTAYPKLHLGGMVTKMRNDNITQSLNFYLKLNYSQDSLYFASSPFLLFAKKYWEKGEYKTYQLQFIALLVEIETTSSWYLFNVVLHKSVTGSMSFSSNTQQLMRTLMKCMNYAFIHVCHFFEKASVFVNVCWDDVFCGQFIAISRSCISHTSS